MASQVIKTDASVNLRAPRRKRLRWYNVVFTALGVVWLIIAFYPVLYMLMTSLRSQQGYLLGIPWLPSLHPTFENYATVLQAGFAHYFLNSVIVSVCSVALIVGCSLLCAYVVVRSRNRAVRVIFDVFLVGLALPIQAAIIPIYVLITKMGLYDTLLGMILPSVAFGLPLTLLILVNFVRDIPNELYESMGLEGASDFRLLRHLVIPLAMPALISVSIYDFVQAWNNFLFPLVLTQSDSSRVMPMAIVSFQGQYTMNVPVTMAAVILSALPLILAYIFGRRYLLRGMLAGFGK
ncbi:carbohydrate ABC transporter permease [Alicyclobacillus acidoterrestris]|uniref:Carbohydrate ABC transporter permease n=1 Tax=Alicyclobacillus acidoterrestris (strain ATCC 49025 / DSM 3922 / CIP 106132 / NCIMB 13137 / GD3B) TaxID=1356854 RepID=T0CA43_ALIAG|nr:carbohydrate ABC transporter permease [Alicyclobacillus acidoterrestris]EPZ52998.1 ABC transporter permease [Alicyclobacillus acidoterrestris ATCC 49025]UNO48516.1 carbohydrate ABC transporter permease [Alicyclobacillus acidoterrestris]